MAVGLVAAIVLACLVVRVVFVEVRLAFAGSTMAVLDVRALLEDFEEEWLVVFKELWLEDLVDVVLSFVGSATAELDLWLVVLLEVVAEEWLDNFEEVWLVVFVEVWLEDFVDVLLSFVGSTMAVLDLWLVVLLEAFDEEWLVVFEEVALDVFEEECTDEVLLVFVASTIAVLELWLDVLLEE